MALHWSVFQLCLVKSLIGGMRILNSGRNEKIMYDVVMNGRYLSCGFVDFVENNIYPVLKGNRFFSYKIRET